MNISFVVAASENNAIGKNNELLWRLPNDTKFFKNITWAMPCIMGRKTFESLGKALNGRKNIVITRQDDWKGEDAIVVKNIQDALKAAEATDSKEVFVIGGAQIYKEMLPMANKIYITRVHASFDDADAFFPEINTNEWQLTNNQDFPIDGKHAYEYSFQVWERK
ncbi:dihydrofolate reductase [Pinibacter soli]|uniref:Dihydrofolate reductase n=1 Tax=Pinibacter soli TaxID=3044211 RepID=A0ABT6RH23_9BACT|nr:dihydrofolate reductase [Pinibacter soli]MDI3321873.1 dihydrofolate reductase [Pinibacter soli]